MIKFFSKLLNFKSKEDEFGKGSNINLRNLYRYADYNDSVAYDMNILYKCEDCNMKFRKGYMLLNTKNEGTIICPYCECKNEWRLTKVSDMDIVNTNLATAPKYSMGESLKIKQMIVDYKVSKANDKQLESYIKLHQNKLNDMYDKAIETLEESK